ncbi:hypothetical protein TSMEX_003428 [Taenia solium]|eukprot:TsM_000360900 transcript=TsM_000360900 gene=TsM_000360900
MDKTHSTESDRAKEVALKTIQRFHKIGYHSAVCEAPLEIAKQETTGGGTFNHDNVKLESVDGGSGGVSECSTGSSGGGIAGGSGDSANGGGRSLFIFSETNLLRKAAKTLIDWGYPFTVTASLTHF